MNDDKLTIGGPGIQVTLHNVRLGQRVRRGHDWRKKWRDDIITNDPLYDPGNPVIPKKRCSGTILGYINVNDELVGDDALDAMIRPDNGPGWCVVRWDNGKASVYSIGAEGIHSLVSSED